MSDDRLAIDGGKPVRTEPFPHTSWGAGVVGEEELELVTEVVRSRSLFRAYGEVPPHMVDDLETEAREFFGANHALAVTSGTAALHCGLAGLGIGAGDEVVMPSIVWLSDFNVPVMLGATPVIADIDRTLSLDPEDLESKITSRTKAIMVVHFMGGVGHLDRILEVGRERGIPVVEDCAQSVGATFRGRRLGAIGDVGCFSFQHNKMMTSGEGGMVITADPIIFERAARFHDLGGLRAALEAQLADGPKLEEFAGAQYRMGELAGAVALAQLRKLDSEVVELTRRHHRRLVAELTETCPGLGFRESGDPEGDAGISLYLDLGSPDPAAWFDEALKAEGIVTGATTRICNILRRDYVRGKSQLHPGMPPFGPGMPGEAMEYDFSDCRNTEDIIGSMVAIMITPKMTDTDVDDIRDAVAKVWRAGER